MSTPRLVQDLMSRNLVTLHLEDSLADADAAMKEHGFRHLPVADGDRLLGLLTLSDVLRFTPSPLEARADQIAVEIAAGTFVADLMTRDVTTVRPDTPLEQAADLAKAGICRSFRTAGRRPEIPAFAGMTAWGA